MTKRAGKRKGKQMGSQRHPPGKIERSPGDDGLKPQESRALELQAIRKGWLIDNPAFQEVREQLMRKLVKHAAQSTDMDEVTKIFRTLSMAEQREYNLYLHQKRLMRADLPQQVETPKETTQANPREVAAELLRNAGIQEAIDFSPKAKDDRTEVPATPEPATTGRG